VTAERPGRWPPRPSRAAGFLLAAAVLGGCAALPAADPDWSAGPASERLVFARARAASAGHGERWGLAALATGAAAFAAGFVAVVAQTAGGEDVRPAFRTGFALMAGGLGVLGVGGAGYRIAHGRRLAWEAAAAALGARAP
jgi:hypothetical protein